MENIRAVEVGKLNISRIPPIRIKLLEVSLQRNPSPAKNRAKTAFTIKAQAIARRNPSPAKNRAKTAFTIKAQAIARMSKAKRIATLFAFVYVLEATAIDHALDILESVVKDLLSSSEREGKKERLRTLKDLDAAALKLSIVGKILLDENCDDSQVREQVWDWITKEQLAEVVFK